MELKWELTRVCNDKDWHVNERYAIIFVEPLIKARIYIARQKELDELSLFYELAADNKRIESEYYVPQGKDKIRLIKNKIECIKKHVEAYEKQDFLDLLPDENTPLNVRDLESVIKNRSIPGINVPFIAMTKNELIDSIVEILPEFESKRSRFMKLMKEDLYEIYSNYLKLFKAGKPLNSEDLIKFGLLLKIEQFQKVPEVLGERAYQTLPDYLL
ncbi:hypothetical protein J4418_04130 [Candidatus Woesearchaeota archaeon]|nr:hypothetical protein [Candidatus Woesearchaeota archaeon]